MTTRLLGPGLPLLFSTDGMLLRRVVKSELLQICSSAVRMFLLAAHALVVGVDVLIVHVNDVLTARADELRRGSLLQLGNRHTKVLAALCVRWHQSLHRM